MIILYGTGRLSKLISSSLGKLINIEVFSFRKSLLIQIKKKKILKTCSVTLVICGYNKFSPLANITAIINLFFIDRNLSIKKVLFFNTHSAISGKYRNYMNYKVYKSQYTYIKIIQEKILKIIFRKRLVIFYLPLVYIGKQKNKLIKNEYNITVSKDYSAYFIEASTISDLIKLFYFEKVTLPASSFLYSLFLTNIARSDPSTQVQKNHNFLLIWMLNFLRYTKLSINITLKSVLVFFLSQLPFFLKREYASGTNWIPSNLIIEKLDIYPNELVLKELISDSTEILKLDYI